jgi:hypothetical protein
MRAVAVLLVVTLVAVTGCASSTPPPPPAPRTFDHLRQLAIVVSGESTFSMTADNAEPGRTFNQILGWGIFGSDASWMRPVAELVHRGINWLLDLDRAKDAKVDLGDLTPRSAVAAAFVRALEDSGRFDEIRAYGREPVGEDRKRADAIVRITVPTWGFVRVQEGDPELFSAFADVRAEMSAPGAGVTIWNATEDVTDAERLPATVFTRDREFARAQLLAVLERAGQRLASELLYERGAGQ